MIHANFVTADASSHWLMGVALIAVSGLPRLLPLTFRHSAPLSLRASVYAQHPSNEIASPTGLPADCFDVLCPTYLSVKELG